MAALMMLIAFEYLAVATAMPVVGRELDGYHLYGLAFSGGLAASVIATVVGGRWSDVQGPGAPLWTGLAGFMGGLVVAGAAPTMDVFLVGRFLQGLGGGLFGVAIYVLVAHVYPAGMHPRVFSLLAAAWVLPSVVGPAITGFVTEHLSWRWVFLGVPMLAAPAALVLRRGLAGSTPIPGDRPGDRSDDRPGDGSDDHPVDWPGDRPDGGLAGSPRIPDDRSGDRPGGGGPAEPSDIPDGHGGGDRAFLPRLAWGTSVAVGAALLQYGSGLRGTGLALVFMGLAVLTVSLPRLLPPGTLRAARGLPSVVALRGLAAGSFLAAEVFVPLTLTQERGLSTTQAGLALTGSALAWSLGSWIQGRWPYGRVLFLRAGTTLIAAGIALTGLTVFHQVPVWAAFAGWTVAGLGVGMVYPTLSVLMLELSAPGEQGENSASLTIGESVYTIVAVAVTGALFTAFHGVAAVYVVCFALIVLMAAAGILVSGRFEHAPATGTMEV
jgi:MFS family permease